MLTFRSPKLKRPRIPTRFKGTPTRQSAEAVKKSPDPKSPDSLDRPTQIVSAGVDRDLGYRRAEDLGPDYRFDQ